MEILKNFIKSTLLFTHLTILVWGTVEFNPFREQIMTVLTVPQNSLVNEFYFLTLLSMYLSSNSMLTFIYEFGRDINNLYYHLLNFIFIFSLMIINFIEFKKCEGDCLRILDDEYIYFKRYYEYLPVMQLVTIISYIVLMVEIAFNERAYNNATSAIIKNIDNNVFMESSELQRARLRLGDDSSSSEGMEL